MTRLERGLIVIGAGKIDLRRLLNGRGETIGSFGNTPTSGQRWNRGHEGGEASTLSAKRLAGYVGSIRHIEGPSLWLGLSHQTTICPVSASKL